LGVEAGRDELVGGGRAGGGRRLRLDEGQEVLERELGAVRLLHHRDEIADDDLLFLVRLRLGGGIDLVRAEEPAHDVRLAPELLAVVDDLRGERGGSRGAEQAQNGRFYGFAANHFNSFRKG